MRGAARELEDQCVPSYAIPRLVAMFDHIQVGDTFKHVEQFVKAIDCSPREDQAAATLKYWLSGTLY